MCTRFCRIPGHAKASPCHLRKWREEEQHPAEGKKQFHEAINKLQHIKKSLWRWNLKDFTLAVGDVYYCSWKRNRKKPEYYIISWKHKKVSRHKTNAQCPEMVISFSSMQSWFKGAHIYIFKKALFFGLWTEKRWRFSSQCMHICRIFFNMSICNKLQLNVQQVCLLAHYTCSISITNIVRRW